MNLGLPRSVVVRLTFHLLFLVPKMTSHLNFIPSYILMLATSKHLNLMSNILPAMAVHARPLVDERAVFLDVLNHFPGSRQMRLIPSYVSDLQPGLDMFARKVVDDRTCERRVR
jgi:hypothetical protein